MIEYKLEKRYATKSEIEKDPSSRVIPIGIQS